MSIARKVTVNTLALLLSNGLGNAVTLLTTIYLARYLEPSLYGEFAFALTLVSFFTIFASLGIDSIVTREIAKEDKAQEELVNTAIMMKIVLSILAIVMVNAAAYMIYPNNVLRLAISVRSSLLFFSSITATLTAVFQAKLKMIYPAAVNFLSKLIFPVAAVLLLISGGGYVQLIAASTLPFAAELLMLLPLSLKSFLRLRAHISRSYVVFLLRNSWPIAFAGITYLVYTRTDMFLISLLNSSDSLGFYSAALNLTEPVQFITGSLIMVVFPLLARFHKSNVNGFNRTLGLTIKAVVLIAAPVTMIGITLNRNVIELVYGFAYSESSLAFAILSAGVIFFSVNIVLGNMLTAINRQKTVMTVVMAGAVMNVILDYLLITKFGFAGAAIATLAVFATSTLIYLTISARITGLKMNIPASLKILASMVAGSAALYALRGNTMAALITGGIVFVIALLATKAFTKEEYNLAKEIVSLKVQAGKW